MSQSIIRKLSIVKIITETIAAKTFVVKPLEDWRPEYKAGQFITLIFYNRAGAQRRSFSFSSSPVVDDHLAFTVKKLDNGAFSRHLIYKAMAGDVLETSGIGGFFVLPNDFGEKQFCFLAAGSGITPCFALIKTLLAKGRNKIFLWYSNSSIAETIFYKELLQLQNDHPEQFFVEFIFSDAADILKRRMSNYLLSQLLEAHMAGTKCNTLFYLCGPYEYMLMADISLKSNGVQAEQIFKEDFFPFKRVLKPRPPDTDAHQVAIHINEAAYTLNVQYPNTITASAKKAGIELPYSCESGQCGSCVATCTRGKLWMAYNEVLTEEEVANGRVLACQAYPIGGDAELVF